MIAVDFSLLIDTFLILLIALLIDFVFGEVPDRVHPTVWMGKVISFLKPRLRDPNPADEKLNGALLGLFVIGLFSVPAYFIILWTKQFLGWAPYIIVAAILLKMTFAMKCMSQYTVPIAHAVEKGDVDQARRLLPFIVRREPSFLTEKQVISAAVESIAESTTDGVTSPFFYFALFGVPGAFAYRAVNTLDSMVGYRDDANRNIGSFSANLDTILNYIPTRLTALLMIASAYFLGGNSQKSWEVLRRDRRALSSVNAGWTISAMAGALGVQLEKPGFYKVGEGDDLLPVHIRRALGIMNLTVLFFAAIVVFPILSLKVSLLSFVGYAWLF